MKKLFALFVVFALCSAATYLDSEQKYFFSSDALINALQNSVEKEQNREKAATLYAELMNQETGMVSIDNLFSICRAAGFNTYKQDGFESCKQFINSLVELEENALGGFCPGLDENGKNPNALKTITDQTRIGDTCSSVNIYRGEVVFKKQYNCTCMAYACNDGFAFKGGACKKIVADEEGFCLRSENKIKQDMTLEESINFCQQIATKNKCQYKTVIIKHKELNVICNATKDEVDNVLAAKAERERLKAEKERLKKEKQIAALKYYQVCDKDKGKTKKTEYCVDSVFNWVNVGMTEADGLAKLYAKEKHGNTIYCDKKYRTAWNDDYVRCATLDETKFYEFKFDDVVESFDKSKVTGVEKGLRAIYGESASLCSSKIASAAKNFGLDARKNSYDGKCYLVYIKEKESTLAKIEGLDNRIFYSEIQIQGSLRLQDQLKQYIQSKGFTIQTFSCESGFKKLYEGANGTSDDVLRCTLNGKPIDFVFDDVSEGWKTTRKAGESGITCKISGGVYANSKCHGLSQKQCKDVDKKLKRQDPTSSGTVWQNGQCVLKDVEKQNNLEKGIQIGTSVIAIADCATVIVGNVQGAMGCTLAVVEIAGLLTEMTTGDAMQQRANDFLKTSVSCKKRSCAVKTLKNMAAKVLSVKDSLTSASTLDAVDSELARLIGLLEPEDLQKECTGNCDYEQLITALGGDPNDVSGKALVVANKIGFVAQFASLGASALRLTGKAIAKLGSKATKTVKIADKANDIGKTAAKADKTTKGVNKSKKATDGVAGSASYTEELEKLGIKHTVVDGKNVYTDIKTGSQMSDVQVLNRMPTSNNDDWAKIGVKQIEQSNGTVRYVDIRPGGGNKFISEEEILKRIDEMPTSVSKSTDNVAKGASDKVDKVGDAAKKSDKVDNAVKPASVSKSTDNVAKGASDKVDRVGDAAKKSDDVVSVTETDKKVLEELFFKGSEEHELANPGKILRKHYPDLSDIELQKKAKDLAEELSRQKARNGGFSDAQLAQWKIMEDMERDINGGLTNEEVFAAKYKKALNLENQRVSNNDGWVYIHMVDNLDDSIDPAGLKFHLNVAPDDVERAAPIIQKIVSKYDIPQWKFSQNANDLIGHAQEGKQFTLYMGKNIGQDEKLLNQLAREIDRTLQANGIRTGRVGENLATGDRLVPGSSFCHYRYDSIDEAGNIGGYNSSYKFIAPKTGDVVKGQKVTSNISEAVRKIDEIFPGNKRVDDAGVYLSKESLSYQEAKRVAAEMNNSDDIIAQVVATDGAGREYKVVSINKSDANKLANVKFQNGQLIKNIDNSSFLRKLDMYKNTEITKIGNTPVFIEDFGSLSGRAIVTVRVGERKIPFYVSTGTAGKMEVPTGKWEVFWGISKQDEWFNKTSIDEIVAHYNSPELKQIADVLDVKLGDPRNIEDVLATAGRKAHGGKGYVATADIGYIDIDQINSGLKYEPSAYDSAAGYNNLRANIQDVKDYLRNLH